MDEVAGGNAVILFSLVEEACVGVSRAGIDQRLLVLGKKLLADDLRPKDVGLIMDIQPLTAPCIARRLAVLVNVQGNNSKRVRSGRQLAIEIPSRLVHVRVFLRDVGQIDFVKQIVGDIWVIAGRCQEPVYLGLILVHGKLITEVIDARRVKTRKESLEKLKVLPDAVHLAQENDVVSRELPDDVLLRTLVVVRDVLLHILDDTGRQVAHSPIRLWGDLRLAEETDNQECDRCEDTVDTHSSMKSQPRRQCNVLRLAGCREQPFMTAPAMFVRLRDAA